MFTKKGSAYALSTVVTWALLGVINRYCIVKFNMNIIIFTSFLIFSGGVALLIIRQQIAPENWKSGVRYSWLYTFMQVVKSFFMISTYLYISTTETSLLINIEVVITYLLVYIFFKRPPHIQDYPGIFLILIGFILFIYTLPENIRIPTTILILIGATASCIRSIVVEATTNKSPATTVRQKCGISGFTMFWGGFTLILFLFLIAGVKFLFGETLPQFFRYTEYLPDMVEILDPATILTSCLAGFFLNSASVYLYYATLRWAHSETFMVFRVFQPALTYSFELLASISYVAIRPSLEIQDFILGGVILLGSGMILILSPKTENTSRSKDFITE